MPVGQSNKFLYIERRCMLLAESQMRIHTMA